MWLRAVRAAYASDWFSPSAMPFPSGRCAILVVCMMPFDDRYVMMVFDSYSFAKSDWNSLRCLWRWASMR